MTGFSVRGLHALFLPHWWDANVAATAAIWELHSQRIRFAALRNFGQLRPLCVFRAEAPDIVLAQCLARRDRGGWCIEQLILAEGADAEWGDVMAVVLAQLGPGTFTYGHCWSLEHSRETDLARVDGVTMEHVQPITVHAIENSAWASDEAWLSDISTNVKRNLKRAAAADPAIETRWYRGRSALRNLKLFAQMNDSTRRRLGMRSSQAVATIRRGLGWLAAPDGLVVGIARDKSRGLATIAGYEAGRNFYYTMGGSAPDNNGASWTLLIEAVLHWRGKSPNGRFVLGYLDESHDGVQREGLLRQRQSVRKTDFDTAIVRFEYRP